MAEFVFPYYRKVGDREERREIKVKAETYEEARDKAMAEYVKQES
jgi:hypothetical protein